MDDDFDEHVKVIAYELKDFSHQDIESEFLKNEVIMEYQEPFSKTEKLHLH